MTKPAIDIVKIARASNRPTGIDYIKHVFTGFFELHGDRRFGDDPAVIGGLALLNEISVTVIAIEKGHNAKERVARNFGASNPEGYRKALRLMKQAEKFHRPIICFIDTSGAFCGIGAEERGQGQAIAENLTEMMTLKVPVISVLIGEGGSGGALALAVADRVWMLENSIYSVISPEGCASILWKDPGRAADAAESLKLTAQDALSMSVIEKIIPEKDLGKDSFYKSMSSELFKQLQPLIAAPSDELTEKRYLRFRSIGVPSQLRE
ncbi:MAG: acetyl-CoA carboxylase carboxyltransferase subunit alpha [Oscillospiraceae bacterium]|nr:acetyl-CoA carboxylase carboxyltransferase subunit alpha [Oscillospiraceae bacterium]